MKVNILYGKEYIIGSIQVGRQAGLLCEVIVWTALGRQKEQITRRPYERALCTGQLKNTLMTAM